MSKSIVLGYDKTICYRCTSGTINFDQVIQFIQKGVCSDSLTAKTIASPLSNHDYVNGGAGKTFDITNFFTENFP